MRASTLLLLAAALTVGCSSSTDKSEDTDVSEDTDAVDTVDTTDTTDTDNGGGGGDTDNGGGGGDTDDGGGGLVGADLVGTFEGHAPVTACFATILDHAVVEVTAVDTDTVSISDGKVTLTCDIVGDTLACDPFSGTEINIQVDATHFCNWPYTVSADITGVTADGFSAQVAFQTAPSPTSAICEAYLGVCNGGSTATFAKFVPSGDNPIPPPAKAMVSR
jgi:hypothetical protein